MRNSYIAREYIRARAYRIFIMHAALLAGLCICFGYRCSARYMHGINPWQIREYLTSHGGPGRLFLFSARTIHTHVCAAQINNMDRTGRVRYTRPNTVYPTLAVRTVQVT